MMVWLARQTFNHSDPTIKKFPVFDSNLREKRLFVRGFLHPILSV
jgi:hypothetical protein